MKLRVPHYYEKFSCIASKCKDNCCFGGWQIDIDEETVEYYRNVKGEFGEKLRESLTYTDTHCFKLQSGVCPFLDSNNLCQIYKELGEEHMGVVCTQFPRFTEYYGNIKEMGIGLACEEAARIILEDKEAFSYVEQEIEEELFEDSEYDKLLAESLFFIRNKMYLIMEDDSLNIKEKLSQLIFIADSVQNCININDYEGIKKCVEASQCISKIDFSEDMIKTIWYSFQEMEILNQDFADFSEKILEVIHPDKDDIKEQYLNCINKYTSMKYDFCNCENLVKYYLHRYFMKATYDHNVIGKIQFIISSLVILNDMNIMMFVSSGKLDKEKYYENIHMLSREVEYSEDNLEILYDEFVFGEVYSIEGMLSVVYGVF